MRRPGRYRVLVCLVAVAALSAVLHGQSGTYTFTTLAGRPPGTPLLFAHAMRADASGNLFVLDGSHAVIRRISPQGTIAIAAGRLDVFSTTREGPAGVATLGLGYGLAVTAGGELYFTQFSQNIIRKVNANGDISITAGSSASGSADGTGTAAAFNNPVDLVADPAGNVYVADVGNRTIRKMTPAGVVTTAAGSPGVTGSADGVGAAASFTNISGLAALTDGSIYIFDNDTIRRLTPDGTVTTIAGSAGQSNNVDGSGAAARFVGAEKLAVDASGNAYVAGGCSIRRMTPSGDVTTIAGATTCGTVDGTGAAARVEAVTGITVDQSGTVWFLQIMPTGAGATVLRSMTPSGTVTTVLPVGTPAGLSDGAGANASFSQPRGAAFYKGLLYETDGMMLRTVTPAGVVKRLTYIPDATRAVALDASGIAFVAAGCAIAKVAPDGTETTLAGVFGLGPGTCGAADGAGAAAHFNLPAGIAVSADGANIYVADTGNSTIRLVSSTGSTTTVLGAAGQTGSSDGFGTASRFNGPTGLALDAAGNLFVADTGNHTIRKAAPDGTVTTFAGAAGTPGSADGTGAAARFNSPAGLALDGSGNLYVADSGNSTIRMITPGGVVTTLAGAVGVAGTTDGAATATRFAYPLGVAVDDTATVYVADTSSNTIRQGFLNAIAPSISVQPANASVVGGTTVQFTVTASGTPSPGFQWQVSINGGASWSDLVDSSVYSGTRTPALTLPNVSGALNGKMYRVVVANPAGAATSIAATLTVNAVVVSPASLRFAAAKAGASGPITASTPPQGIAVSFTAQTSTWTAVSDQPWLQITGGSGSGPGQFVVALSDPGNTIGGSTTLSATITVTCASGLVASLPVALTVDLTNPSNAPFGSFDTPSSGVSPYQGSIAVTGWALDDIGVDHVEIWRDAVAGETTPVYTGSGPGNGKIFIANASFVSGARPDVAAAYSTRPNAQRAGWGYLLLTYGLWNQGNGIYKLYAFAFDVDGRTVSTLGTKTISVSNATATKPFGTIDTPGQGGTVSGVVINFGWALTPGTSCSIANPNVQVSIDSGALTPVVYGDARSDVAGAFPGTTNAAAAGAHYSLDTTPLTDGVHTIGWMVTDSCGRAEGIGSRFFTVLNGASVASDTAAPDLKVAPTSPASSDLKVRLTSDLRPTTDVGRVLRPGGAEEALATASDGTRVVRVEQTERVEVQLPGVAPYVAGALPLGSSFDPAANTFYWQPAAGFLGAYDLQFLPADAGSHNGPLKLRVVVGPPIRMVIDTPHAGNVLNASGFTVAGWAVDLASLDGAGIDTLHVWAYPIGPSTSSGQVAAPQFVGVAKSGGARPDVAHLYGASFGDAGFTLAGTLPPGTYDLVVYAHSAASNTFAGAQTVRVIAR